MSRTIIHVLLIYVRGTGNLVTPQIGFSQTLDFTSPSLNGY